MKKLLVFALCSSILLWWIMLTNAKENPSKLTNWKESIITKDVTQLWDDRIVSIISWINDSTWTDDYTWMNHDTTNGWICDFNGDWEVNIADINRYNDNCSITNWRNSKKCDLNNDWEINLADNNTFNDICMSKVLSTEWDWKPCDVDGDWKVNISDVTRFIDNCNSNWWEDKKCDIDKDWEFDIEDITMFNSVCYNELLWVEDDNINFQEIVEKTSENNVYLMDKNSVLWEFAIKPKNSNTINLKKITIRNRDKFSCNDISLTIDNEKINNCKANIWDLTYEMNKNITSKWVTVKIILNEEHRWTYMVWLLSINEYHKYKSWLEIPFEFFTSRYEDTLVYIKNQKNNWNETVYTLWIENNEKDLSINSIWPSAYNVSLFTWQDCIGSSVNIEPQTSMWDRWRQYFDWEKIKALNEKYSQTINSISYIVGSWKYICISKSEFPNYFIVNWKERKIYPKLSKSEELINKISTWQIITNWITEELNEAYHFAYENWITTSKNIEKAKMNSPLTRIAMAKMLSQYAINVLWKEPDTSKWTPNFNDISDKLNNQYDNAVTLSYQLWIMWQWTSNFRPNNEVTRAEFATALSRMLYWIKDGKWNTKYYEPHIAKLYEEWIITNTNPKIKEKRWYVMTMLMRTAN